MTANGSDLSGLGDSPPTSDEGDEIPTLEQLAHQVHQLRLEEQRWHVTRETSLHHLADGVVALVEATGHLKADLVRIAGQIAALRAAQDEQAEQIGRIAAELAARARQDSIHEEAITGVHRVATATQAELALARAKWLGWRGLAVTLALAVFEALKHWIGG